MFATSYILIGLNPDRMVTLLYNVGLFWFLWLPDTWKLEFVRYSMYNGFYINFDHNFSLRIYMVCLAKISVILTYNEVSIAQIPTYYVAQCAVQSV